MDVFNLYSNVLKIRWIFKVLAVIVSDSSLLTNGQDNPLGAAPNCRSSVAPCICNGPAWDSSTEITCNRVSVTTVRTMFGRLTNTVAIGALTLTPNANDTMIPANVIGKQKIAQLTLNCPSRFTNFRVDRLAFASSAQTVSSVSISNCDLFMVDWSFLTNFTKMTSFSVSSSDNIHWTFNTFPSGTLTSLTSITLQKIRNMNGFQNPYFKYPAIVAQGLTAVTIKYCYDFGDDALENLLTKWITPSSVDTLTQLDLSGNSLTQIPLDMPKFKKLYVLRLFENLVPWTIQSYAFNIELPPSSRSTLMLDDSEIQSIEPGAFQGIPFYQFIYRTFQDFENTKQLFFR